MKPTAVYRRPIRASLARIWENVLDWEHLPWLHSESFAGIELLQQEREGWRAWVALPGEKTRRALVDVRLHRPELHYWTRTVEGSGAGTDIRTSLAPRAEHVTDITVEFFVPGLGPAAVQPMGEFYTRLYTRLWDEDEAMMTRRESLFGRASRLPVPRRFDLGAEAELRARLPLIVGEGKRAVRLLELDGAIVAHAAACPHLGGPLGDSTPCAGVVTCPWHGYRFDLRSGASADGRALRLPPPPLLQVDESGNVSLEFQD